MTIEELREKIEDAKDLGLVPTHSGDRLSDLIDKLLAVAEATMEGTKEMYLHPAYIKMVNALEDLLEER